MRIAQILPELNVGGVETGTVDLAKALKRRGDEPFIISNGGALVNELVKAKIPHLELPVHKKSLSSLFLVRKLASFIERERIDIIHARSRIPAWLAYLAVRRTNCDFITTCHGYYSKHFLSRVMGFGKRVIVTSHSIGRRMIDDFGVPPNRVTLIHRGVDLSQYSFDAAKYNSAPSGKFTVINIGRITPIKGHAEFIQAIHWLSKRLPNLEAWIVGSADRGKESYLDDLKLMVVRLGLAQKVKFLGVRRDIPDLIQKADLLVLSSRIPEAFGRVLIEAGAVGTAVCASRIGGILDIVNEGENGLLFAPQNVEEMALVMEKLLRDRSLSKKMAGALRKKVENEFNLDLMVEKTCQVYQEVKQQKKILVTKLGAVGDLVLAVPSFRMLRTRYPQAHISLLVEPKLVPLVQRSPFLNEILTFDRSGRRGKWRQILKMGKRMGTCNFDFSIDLQNNWKTHLMSFLARIPKRYGYRRGWLGFLLTHPVVTDDRSLPPVEHQFQVLRRAGVIHYDDTMELWTEPEDDTFVARTFHDAGFNVYKPIIGLVLGSSKNWATKRWPIENFRLLADRLVEKLECRVVLIGTEEDKAIAKTFDGAHKSDILDMTGKTNMTQLVSLVKRLNVLVTGDSAPLHIASAMGVRVVALFGPTEPRRHMPPGKGHVVLAKHLPCQPCYRGICKIKDQLLCLRSISVDEVFEAVDQQLSR
jgi:lipopolysaccharide heptosyltransferase II